MSGEVLPLEQVKAFMKMYRWYRSHLDWFPPEKLRRHFPRRFLVVLAERILASRKYSQDALLLEFVASVLTKCVGPRSIKRVDSVLPGLYLGLFALPLARYGFSGQAWDMFDEYAEECFKCSLHAAISTGTEDEKLDRMKTLVRANLRGYYPESEARAPEDTCEAVPSNAATTLSDATETLLPHKHPADGALHMPHTPTQ